MFYSELMIIFSIILNANVPIKAKTYANDLNKNDLDLVSDLEIHDLNNSFLLDGFPVYFTLKLSSFNRKYSILFKQALNKNFAFKNHFNFYKTYNSVNVNVSKRSNSSKASIYEAECVLFLSSDAHSIYIKNGIGNMKKWIYQNSNNLTNIYNIMLTISKINSNDKLLITVNFDTNDTLHRSYVATRNKIFNNEEPNTSKKKEAQIS